MGTFLNRENVNDGSPQKINLLIFIIIYKEIA